MKALVVTAVSAKPQEVPMTVFGKAQSVVVSGGNERGLTVKMAGSSAGLELPWERLSLSDLAEAVGAHSNDWKWAA